MTTGSNESGLPPISLTNQPFLKHTHASMVFPIKVLRLWLSKELPDCVCINLSKRDEHPNDNWSLGWAPLRASKLPGNISISRDDGLR